METCPAEKMKKEEKMKHPYQKAVLVVMTILLATSLAACGSKKEKKDPNAVLTEAVQTVSVQLTADAAKLPPATQTPMPTVAIPTATMAVATLPPVTAPTNPPAAPTASSGNLAQYLSQSPADDTTMSPGQTFTMVWTVKNIGTTTWTPEYLIRFFATDQAGVVLHVGENDQRINKTVKPGETTDIKIQMKAPSSNIKVTNTYALSDDTGANFQPLTIRIKVSDTAPTKTVTPTAEDGEEATETPEPTETTEPTAGS
jgi:hypothetical protein